MTGTRTLVVAGDSFVDGAGATDRHGWAHRLGERLEGYESHVLGHGGDTVRDLRARLDDVVAPGPDLVAVQVGINDSRHRPSAATTNEVPPAAYDVGLRAVVDRLRRGCPPHATLVLVGTTPVDESLTTPYKPDKHYVDAASRRYNGLARAVCRDEGVQFVDAYAAFDARSDPHSLLADGVHPNDEGHHVVCERVLETLAVRR